MILEKGERTVTHKPALFPGYWTSSQLGCWRRCLLLALGIEGDFYDSPVLEEGRVHEDDIVARMMVKGLVVTDRFSELKHPTLPLRGHPDGRFVVTETPLEGISVLPGRYLLEAKSMDRAFFSKAIKDFRSNFPHFYRQIQSYSLMSEGHEAIYTPIKNRATGEIHELIFEPDEGEWEIIESNIALLQVAVHTPGFDYKQLPCPEPDSYTGRYCPYRDREMCETYTNIPDITEQELVQAVQDYQEGKTVEDQGSKTKAAAKRILQAYLRKHNLKKMMVGTASVGFTPYPSRSCDYDRLKELSPEIYDEVVEESLNERFNCK